MNVVAIVGEQCEVLPFPDQEAIRNLPKLIEAIRARLPVGRIITQAYEGGHPDHDATALAVSIAVAGTSTPVFEYPSYHAFQAPMVASVFLPHPSNPVVEHCVLNPMDVARKLGMFDCFLSQRQVLERFPLTEEQFRSAPAYDFLEPPHPGPLYYESRDMGITYSEWRELARAALVHYK